MKASDIRIGMRMREDVGDLAPLAQSIAEIGLLHPIVVRSDGMLVVGMRRFLAMRDVLGWQDIPARVVCSLDDAVLALKAERDENTQRIQLTPHECVEVARLMEDTEKEAARIRQLAGLKQNAHRVGNLPTRENGRALDHVAGTVGMSRRNYEKARAVVEAADKEPELFGDLAIDLKKPDASVSKAFSEMRTRQNWQKLKSAENVERLESLGVFSVLYADPPWQYEHGTTDPGDAIENHYPTMTIDEICALSVQDIADKDSILFLWATAPKLDEALKVVEAWGFRYRTHMIWVKDQIGLGNYVRGQHELLLIAKRGNMRTPLPEDRPASVLHAPVGAHSVKPKRVYELIEQMYPALPKVELFARTARVGWRAWGLEANIDSAA